jgi:LysM repeat protein
MVLMNTATASQLPLDFPRFPDVESPTLLRVVPPVEPAPAERLATVHRLVTDVFAAEPAVVNAVRRQTTAEGVVPAASAVSPRVYRQRRFLAAVVLGLLVSALSLLGGELIGRVTGTTGAPAVAAVGEPIVHVVQPGDTLWSIAVSINPNGRDLRATVDRLVDAAGGSILQPGQRIALPVG